MSTPTTDGGRVEAFVIDTTSSSGSVQHSLHIQKYDSAGQPVGSEFVYNQSAPFDLTQVQPLAGGGYAVAYGWAFRGYYDTVTVFDAAGHDLRDISLQSTAAGAGFAMAASAAGGFLVSLHTTVSSGMGVSYDGPPVILAYDNTGAQTAPVAKVTGDLPTITTSSDGHYHLTWTDGNLTHTVDYDPRNPPDFSAPPAPTVVGVFDNATGQMLPAAGGYAVDTLSPIIRVAVNHTGFLELSQSTTSSSESPYMTGGVAVTAADVARGYVDLVTRGDIAPDNYYLRFKSDVGVPSASATTPSISVTGDPHITQAYDDVGPSTGVLADHAVTDDATPTLHLSLAQANAPVGATVQILDGSAKVGQVTLSSDDVSRGYVEVTTTALAKGVHHLQTMVSSNAFAHPSAYNFTVDVEPSGGSSASGQTLTAQQTPDTLTGGSGDDTLYASQGPDQLTGGAGHDAFVFRLEPWAPAHIKDFVVGTDRMDISALFQKGGYTGSDPIADGWVRLFDDGNGGTEVFFDPDGPNPAHQWPDNIIDIEHVPVAGLTWAQIAGSASASPPPPASSPPASSGQVLTAQDGGQNLVGGPGTDTLIGAHGQDTMTGGGGADHFTWTDLPWAYAEITDFTQGSDKLDVAALLTKYGYSGSDPIGEGYIKFGDDGQGNTWVYFDKDGWAGSADQWGTHLATLDHVAAAGVSSSDFLFH